MENKKIMHYGELIIPKSDLDKLGKEELAFLSTLAFAIDEISVFQKLTTHSMGAMPNDDSLKAMYQIQQNAITRVLCSKVFEAIRIFDDGVKLLCRNGHIDSVEQLKKSVKKIEKLKGDKSYALAKTIRDHSTNHYISSETVKNIEHAPDNAPMRAMLHKNQGNSFYPFGEEYVFLGRINRHFMEEREAAEILQEVRAWIDWSMKASNLLSKIFSGYLIWLHKERFPDWALRKKTPYLETHLFSEIGDYSLPICFSTDAHDRRKDD